jgi:hypothetical protein
VTRRTKFIDFVWDGVNVDKAVPPYNPYSVRWSGFIKPKVSGLYSIYTASDDGVRLWIDKKLLIDNWTCHAESEDVCQMQLEAGTYYPLQLDYFEASGTRGQRIRLYWESPLVEKEYVPESCLFYSR